MKRLIIFLFMISYFNLISDDDTFPFLDIKSMGAYEFIKQNPECDGRDVVIFILDNSVDPSIPGMLKTSTGNPKVIDMQDFSNQLVLNLKEAEKDKNGNIEYLKADNLMVFGADALNYQPLDGKYYYGIIDEKKHFQNSDVKDLNSNGRRDDKFAVIAFKINMTESIIREFKGLVKPKAGSEQWVYYIDENNNGNIDDEKPRFTYKYNLDYFNFYSGEKGKRPLVVMSANIDASSNKMVINTCDGSHGTHCGGIACGYEIYNLKGNNGIAPGAYIVSLKIGSNLLSGGATTTAAMKKAYEYGIEFLRESGIKYGVYSMSYGIGSETPGRSEIEKYLNDFALKHPNIIVVTSNGNNGPGINSTGNPAGANNILSVGAMLPVDVLKNLYGSLRNKPWVTNFSSRGGESNKPDVIAPGGASSSVPAYERGDAFWGTSMSCPQVAGAAAILFSAASHFKIKVDGAMLKKAIKYGAVPLPGYTNADQGTGLVNTPNSFNYLTILSERREFDKSADYHIETTNSYFSDKKGTSAFWKSSGYYPQGADKQIVSVKPLFYNNLPAETKHNFYRVFTLSSDSPWLKTDKNEFYLRGELGGSFAMIFDSSKIKAPGLYSGRITAKPKGEPGSNFADFDVQANIVIPYKFTAENNYTLKLKNEKLEIGDIKRIFIETPIGASAAKITISHVEGKHFGIMAYLFNPVGRNSGVGTSTNETLRKSIEINIAQDKMMHGIWEIIPTSQYQSLNDSYYDLTVQFFMLQSDTEKITKLSHNAGDMPKGSFKIINLSGNLIYAGMKGSIQGYSKNSIVSHKGSSVYTKSIKIGSDIAKCEFRVSMSDEDYNKSTDISFNIFDENGVSLLSNGLNRKSGKFNFNPPKAGVYRIEFEAGYTDSSFESVPWNFELNEEYYYKNPNNINFESSEQKLYPGNWNEVKFSTSAAIVMAPEDYSTFGNIEFTDKVNNNVIFLQEIEIK